MKVDLKKHVNVNMAGLKKGKKLMVISLENVKKEPIL